MRSIRNIKYMNLLPTNEIPGGFCMKYTVIHNNESDSGM